jgi:transposase
MDNAKIHHGPEISELCAEFGVSRSHVSDSSGAHPLDLGVRVEYLPPYSPDLNPIEECFSKIKHFLRRHRDYYSQTIGDGILFDMYEIMDIITANDAAGYFRHAGYF